MCLTSSAETNLATYTTLWDDGRTVMRRLTINRLVYITYSAHSAISTATPVRRSTYDQRVAGNGRRVRHTYFTIISSIRRDACKRTAQCYLGTLWWGKDDGPVHHSKLSLGRGHLRDGSRLFNSNRTCFGCNLASTVTLNTAHASRQRPNDVHSRGPV